MMSEKEKNLNIKKIGFEYQDRGTLIGVPSIGIEIGKEHLISYEDFINQMSLFKSTLISIEGNEPYENVELLNIIVGYFDSKMKIQTSYSKLYFISILTNGLVDFTILPAYNYILRNLTIPIQVAEDPNKWKILEKNFLQLSIKDSILYPVGNEKDYKTAINLMKFYQYFSWTNFYLLSINPDFHSILYNLMKFDELPIRLQVPLERR